MAWANTDLATVGDVKDRYPKVYDLCFSDTDADKDAEINDYIQKAKNVIGRKLDVIIATNYGTDFNVNDPKDLILNPEIFKHACVAQTLKLMFENVELAEDDFNNLKKKNFENEFREEFKIATTLIEFDEDEDGQIDQESNEAFDGNIFFRI